MDAWLKYAPPGRFPLTSSVASYKASAVSVLLFPFEGRLSTLLLVRAFQEKDRHSGQISFPGGKADEEDEDLIHTALRELEEETGIFLSLSHVIGTMTSLAIPVSGFEVTPVVMYTEALPPILLSESEAVSFHVVALEDLENSSEHKVMDMKRDSLILRNIPYMDMIDDIPLWGATAMMLAELLEWIRRVEAENKSV